MMIDYAWVGGDSGDRLDPIDSTESMVGFSRKKKKPGATVESVDSCAVASGEWPVR